MINAWLFGGNLHCDTVESFNCALQEYIVANKAHAGRSWDDKELQPTRYCVSRIAVTYLLL